VPGHLEKRSKNSWTILIDTGRDPATGKRKRLYRAFQGTKIESEKEMARIIAEIEKSTYIEKIIWTAKGPPVELEAKKKSTAISCGALIFNGEPSGTRTSDTLIKSSGKHVSSGFSGYLKFTKILLNHGLPAQVSFIQFFNFIQSFLVCDQIVITLVSLKQINQFLNRYSCLFKD
jgi:hypothetical protein